MHSPAEDPDHYTVRTAVGTEGARLELLATVVGRYREVPRLSLTAAQAGHLFAWHVQICEALLNDLVDAGWLRRSSDGRYRLV